MSATAEARWGIAYDKLTKHIRVEKALEAIAAAERLDSPHDSPRAPDTHTIGSVDDLPVAFLRQFSDEDRRKAQECFESATSLRTTDDLNKALGLFGWFPSTEVLKRCQKMVNHHEGTHITAESFLALIKLLLWFKNCEEPLTEAESVFLAMGGSKGGEGEIDAAILKQCCEQFGLNIDLDSIAESQSKRMAWGDDDKQTITYGKLKTLFETETQSRSRQNSKKAAAAPRAKPGNSTLAKSAPKESPKVPDPKPEIFPITGATSKSDPKGSKSKSKSKAAGEATAPMCSRGMYKHIHVAQLVSPIKSDSKIEERWKQEKRVLLSPTLKSISTPNLSQTLTPRITPKIPSPMKTTSAPVLWSDSSSSIAPWATMSPNSTTKTSMNSTLGYTSGSNDTRTDTNPSNPSPRTYPPAKSHSQKHLTPKGHYRPKNKASPLDSRYLNGSGKRGNTLKSMIKVGPVAVYFTPFREPVGKTKDSVVSTTITSSLSTKREILKPPLVHPKKKLPRLDVCTSPPRQIPGTPSNMSDSQPEQSLPASPSSPHKQILPKTSSMYFSCRTPPPEPCNYEQMLDAPLDMVGVSIPSPV